MLPDSRRPRRFADGDEGDGDDRDLDPESKRLGMTEYDLVNRRRRRDRHGHHVVDEERGGGDEAGQRAEVLLRHGVRAAAATDRPGRPGGRQGDDREQDRDGDRDLERQRGARAGAGQDEDAQDLLGRVGRRADRVRAEDRQRLLLGQPLADLLLAREGRPIAIVRIRAQARPMAVLGALAAALATSCLGPVYRK